MDISIEKDKLFKVLSLVEPFSEPKPAQPVLGQMLIEAEKEQLRFSATNLEISVQLTVSHDGINNTGAVLLPARKLFDIVKLLPEATVELNRSENAHADIRSGACSRVKLLASNPEDFPRLPEPPAESFEVPVSVLLEAIRLTSFCITQEETRYALSGIRLEVSESGRFTAVATDGHRLSLFERDIQPPQVTAGEVLLPGKAVSALSRLLASIKTEGQTIAMSWTENHIFFSLPGLVVIARRGAGQFPNYRAVLANKHEHRLRIPSTQLREVIRRVALMSDSRSPVIRFSVGSDQLTISAESSDIGSAREILPIESYSGPEITLGFNARYVLDFLDTGVSEQIEVRFKDADSQVYMQPTDEEDLAFRMQYTLMPCRLAS